MAAAAPSVPSSVARHRPLCPPPCALSCTSGSSSNRSRVASSQQAVRPRPVSSQLLPQRGREGGRERHTLETARYRMDPHPLGVSRFASDVALGGALADALLNRRAQQRVGSKNPDSLPLAMSNPTHRRLRLDMLLVLLVLDRSSLLHALAQQALRVFIGPPAHAARGPARLPAWNRRSCWGRKGVSHRASQVDSATHIHR